MNNSRVLLSVGVAVTWLLCLAHPVIPQSKPAPTHYYYRGESVKLDLDEERVVVRFDPTIAPADYQQSLQSTGFAGREEIHPLVGRAMLLTLTAGSMSSAEHRQRIDDVVQGGAVEFISPVFRGPAETFFSPLSEILMRVRVDKPGMAAGIVRDLAPGLEIVATDYANIPGFTILRGEWTNGFDALSEANRLSEDPRVEWAEPNMLLTGGGDLTPNDPGFPLLWGIRNTGQFGGVVDKDMDGDLAWDTTLGSSTIKVLIIDVGVQQGHPDINQLPGEDFTGAFEGGNPVNQCDNHGTPVAGCVSAIVNNSLGTVGIAPGCVVLSARTFVSNLSCNGTWSSEALWTVNALNWGQIQGVRVTNNSNYYGFTSSAIDAAYFQTREDGIVHFASAGNDNLPSVTYPASLPYVNAIGAIAQDGLKAGFSNYGSAISTVAPGQWIYSTDRTGALGYDASSDYAYVAGTSFASPYTAGVAALVLSLDPGLSSMEVEDRLRCSADDLGNPGVDNIYGHGLVNAYAALHVCVLDGDSDCVAGSCDNCPLASNPGQEDQDTDGVGDVCDNCPTASNPSQSNADGDSLGDACDVCPNDAFNDADGDSWCANEDNCPSVSNVFQDDDDLDGIGNACDNCPDASNPDQLDADSNGIGDACDCACLCHGDPACDSVIANVVDVVNTISVAFRGAAPFNDPSPTCPRQSTDVDCSGSTDVVDVVKTVSVAFRGASAAAEYCDPCTL